MFLVFFFYVLLEWTDDWYAATLAERNSCVPLETHDRDSQSQL